MGGSENSGPQILGCLLLILDNLRVPVFLETTTHVNILLISMHLAHKSMQGYPSLGSTLSPRAMIGDM